MSPKATSHTHGEPEHRDEHARLAAGPGRRSASCTPAPLALPVDAHAARRAGRLGGEEERAERQVEREGAEAHDATAPSRDSSSSATALGTAQAMATSGVREEEPALEARSSDRRPRRSGSRWWPRRGTTPASRGARSGTATSRSDVLEAERRRASRRAGARWGSASGTSFQSLWMPNDAPKPKTK